MLIFGKVVFQKYFRTLKKVHFLLVILIILIFTVFLTSRLIRENTDRSTHASNNEVVEAESGILTGNVITKNDSQASGTSAIQFIESQKVQRFPPPTISKTVMLPSSIDGSGSTNVISDLQSLINSSPDGTLIQFPANKIFRIDSRLKIYGKKNIIIDGAMSRIKNPTSNHTQDESIFDIYNSQHITLRNFIVEGSSPTPGILIDGTQDQAHGINIYEANFVEMSHITFEKLWGDPFQVDGDIWPRGIWMHDCNIVSAGRSGFSVLAAYDVYFERNTIGQVGLHAFNIEPWRSSGGGINVNVLDNTVGSYDHGNIPVFGVMFAAEGAQGSTVTDVTISRNTITNKSLQTQITTLPRRQRITITNNKSLVSASPYYGYPGVLNLSHIDGLVVTDNVQTLSSGVFASIIDSTNVVYKH